MRGVDSALREHLLGGEVRALDEFRAQLQDTSTFEATLLARFASLPRTVGRRPLDPGLVRTREGIFDLGAFRACDLAAAILLADSRVSAELALALHDGGDRDERRMLFRSLATDEAGRHFPVLWARAHRQNDPLLFAAAFLDADVAARLLPDPDWNRILLKTAFLDLALERLLGFERRLEPGLSAMLRDFAAERRAAGRPVWRGTFVIGRLLGDPELLREGPAAPPV
jgi:hypothetical protein